MLVIEPVTGGTVITAGYGAAIPEVPVAGITIVVPMPETTLTHGPGEGDGEGLGVGVSVGVAVGVGLGDGDGLGDGVAVWKASFSVGTQSKLSELDPVPTRLSPV
jgi:hypothetical protein